MSADERMSYEQREFMELIKDKNGMMDQKDESIIYYAIDQAWYKQWNEFIRGKREMPRDIENRVLKNYIQTERLKRQSREYDNDLGLTEGDDYVLVQ